MHTVFTLRFIAERSGECQIQGSDVLWMDQAALEAGRRLNPTLFNGVALASHLTSGSISSCKRKFLKSQDNIRETFCKQDHCIHVHSTKMQTQPVMYTQEAVGGA